MPETQWMTLRETADMMKRLPDQVTRMCEDGKLEYYMEDGRYFVSRESIDLFMHPPIGQSAPAIPDSNGTPRRQYGRAPQDIDPSPESSSGSQAVNGSDEAEAAGGSAPEDEMEETAGRGDEMAETAGVEQPAMYARPAEEPADTEDLAESEVVQPADDLADTEGPVDVEVAQPAAHSAVTDHEEAVEDLVEAADDLVETAEDLVDDAAPPEEVLPGEDADPEPSNPDGEHAEAAEAAEAAADPGETDARAAEILADLRAALSRHAREHKAFCDEIAALADALESTLSHEGDKTSELTREISSLLARYTRR